MVLDLRPNEKSTHLPYRVIRNKFTLVNLLSTFFLKSRVASFQESEAPWSSRYKRIYFNLTKELLLRRLKRLNPDVVISHFLFGTSLCASKLAKAAGIPHYLRVHTPYSTLSEESLNSLLADTKAISSSTESAVHGLGLPSDTPIIRQQLSDHALEFNNERPDVPIVKALAVGRLVPKKGFTSLLKEFSELPKDISLDIIGDGPLRSELVSLKNDLNLENVNILGQLSHDKYLQYLKNSHVLIVSSEATEDVDGIPQVLLEAMSVGTLVCTTLVGGIGEVADETTAFIMKNGKLTEGIRHCLDNRSIWDSIKYNARKRIEERFSSQLTGQHLASAIES